MPATGRDSAICDATLALLAEVGYDRMSMDAVAARAHASKATIYRRWPGKREMVVDALRRRHEPPAVLADTGSLRGDLVASLGAMAESTGCDEAELMAGVLHAMRQAPELGACMRDQVLDRKRAVFRTIVERAVSRRELPSPAGAPTTALADLAHELAGALWVQRVLVVGAAVDDAFIAHVVDDVLVPLLTHRPTPDSPRPPNSPADPQENP